MNISEKNQAQDIIDAENARIDSKEQSYQNMQFGKKRVLDLNKNFQDRTTAFNWIVAVFLITLAFIILFYYLDSIIPGIHEYVIVINFIVFLIGISYCIYLYSGFNRRDPSDFDKILYSPPSDSTLSPDQAAANASINGSVYDSGTGMGSGTDSGTGYGTGMGSGTGYGTGMGSGTDSGTGYGTGMGSGTDSGTGYGTGMGSSNGTTIPGMGSGTGSGTGMGSSNGETDYAYNPSLQSDSSNINSESARISGSVSTDSGTSVSGNVYGSSVSGNNFGSSVSDNIYGLNITTSVPRSENQLQKILSSMDKQVNACNISSIVNSSGLNSSSVSGSGIGSGNRPYTEIQTTPLLGTGQIYIGNNGRTTISIIDSKTFHLYNLHVSKDVFISNNGIDFVVTNNPSITASVVTSGPEGCLGQQINGQAIRLSFGGKYYYFYKSDYPALLIRGDEFLATNGQTYIEVISQNEINLMNVNPNENNNNQLVRTYSSTNGVNFIDKKNSKNIAIIIIDGPNSQSLGKKIYGQGIKIYNEIDTREITYFYYNGNKLEEIQNDISTADITTNEDTTQAPIVTTQAPIITTQAPIVTTQAPKVPGLAWKSFNGPYPFNYNNSVPPHLFFHSDPNFKNNNTKYYTFKNDRFFTSSNTKKSTVGTTVRDIWYDNNIAFENNANLFGFKNNQYNRGGENISLLFKGYFKPDRTGPWKFLLGNETKHANDDISVFWMDDKNNVNGTTSHWPPSDTNWNFKSEFNSSHWIYETPSLTAGTYYPIRIAWGQSWGGSFLKFCFLGPNDGSWRSNGDGFFFSDTNQNTL